MINKFPLLNTYFKQNLILEDRSLQEEIKKQTMTTKLNLGCQKLVLMQVKKKLDVSHNLIFEEIQRFMRK